MIHRSVSAGDLHRLTIDMQAPTLLFAQGDHAIYWLGIDEVTAFRCNTYLIKDGDQAILVDPGSTAHFHKIQARVAQILPPTQVTGMVLCHQDPDVASSMVDWIDLIPDIPVYTTPRTQVLLPHYGRKDYNYQDVVASPLLPLPSGAALRFIPAPFLHFPGAFVTYDLASRYLLSGDVWAALDLNWRLVVESFDLHAAAMNLFHRDYMASNIACRGFINTLAGIAIDAILPQHGSIIGPEFVTSAIEYLRNLRCGTDLIYADIQ